METEGDSHVVLLCPAQGFPVPTYRYIYQWKRSKQFFFYILVRTGEQQSTCVHRHFKGGLDGGERGHPCRPLLSRARIPRALV